MAKLFEPPQIHLKPYRDLLRLLWKYGQRDVLAEKGVSSPNGADKQDQGDPSELAADLERMGPTYVKLGQILSGQLNILSRPYMDALTRLQNNVAPFGFDRVQEIVQRNLGKPVEHLYAEFEPEPLASASLGQVHKAKLLDGTTVAVKVQRPGAANDIQIDLDAIEPVASLLDTVYSDRYGFADLLEQTRRSLARELDYRQEAANQRAVAHAIREYPEVVIPQAVDDLTCREVLTMDFIVGVPITKSNVLARPEVDGPRLADRTFKAYLEMILIAGVFHGDPHPGNLLLTEDGRVALLDLGMVGRVAPRMRERLIQLVLAVVEGRGEAAADTAVKLGTPLKGFAYSTFKQEIAEIVMDRRDQSLEGLGFGQTVIDIARICGEQSIRVPPQLTMMGKALVQLDQVGRELDPGFTPREAIDDHLFALLAGAIEKNLSLRRSFDYSIEVKELMETAPGRVNALLERLSRDDRGLKIDAIDEHRLLSGIEKVANRITLGLVTAACAIGGSLVMGTQAPPVLWGYPVLAVLMYAIAAVGGTVFAISTWANRDKS